MAILDALQSATARRRRSKKALLLELEEEEEAFQPIEKRTNKQKQTNRQTDKQCNRSMLHKLKLSKIGNYLHNISSVLPQYNNRRVSSVQGHVDCE